MFAQPLAWMVSGVVAAVLSMGTKPAIRLVYNASDSAPRGFYSVSPPTHLAVGDYILARLPAPTAAFAAARGYVPSSVPVLKKIAAISGQPVCVRDGAVSVDGIVVAHTLPEDGQHRSLVSWNHCRRLLPGEFFLLNTGSVASFDSRYFGPLDVSFVRGRATRW